jgi:hypothetical protein
MSVTAMFPVKYRHPLISLSKLYKGYWFVFTNDIRFVGGHVLTINKSVEITFFMYAHGQKIGKTNNLKVSVNKYTKGLNMMAKLG